MKFGEPLAFHIARNIFGLYCVPSESLHRPCAIRTLKGKVWERETIEAVRKYMRKGGIVCAGAFFGDMLPPFAKMAFPNLVWAFEPNPVNFTCASITRLINNLGNVRLHNAGLGPASGQAQLSTVDRTGLPLGGGSFISEDGEQTINMMAIDDVVDDADVAVIQLDVEGHEAPCLKGAEKTIKRCQPLIVLEHIEKDALKDEWVAALFAEVGYQELTRTNANTIYQVPVKPSSDTGTDVGLEQPDQIIPVEIQQS